MDRNSILKEAIRIEIELSQLKEPNSPSKTHYMVKLSDDFIKAAGSVDTNSLLNSIKVKDISLSTLKDEKGIFAFTSKKHEFPIYEIEGSSDTTVNVLRQGREYALLQRNIPKENNPLNIKDPTPYIVAWNFNAKDGKCNWGQGHYCGSLDSGCSLYSEKEQAENNYKFFYAGSGGQDKDAIQFQKETGWKRIWGSDSQGLNGDTWVVYRSVEDLPKWLQEYAAAQEKSGELKREGIELRRRVGRTEKGNDREI